jgi:hypothetical protein
MGGKQAVVVGACSWQVVVALGGALQVWQLQVPLGVVWPQPARPWGITDILNLKLSGFTMTLTYLCLF